MSQAVIIAESNERTQLKFNPLGQCGITCNLILNDRRVFSLHHEHGFLNLDAVHFIGKDWKRIQAKSDQELKALRVNYTGITVHGQIEFAAIERQCLFEF